MGLQGKRIGIGITGSHTTFHLILPEIERLINTGADVYIFVTHTMATVDSPIETAERRMHTLREMTKNKVITSIIEAEPFGPKFPLDAMVIAPMTGTSLSKFAQAASDSPVLFAAKSTLRNESPVILGISTNDALGLNGYNVMKLLNTKDIYFIPLGQDDPYLKPRSMVAHMHLLQETVQKALENKQLQPLFIPYHS